MDGMVMTKKDINPNDYYLSIERFKKLVNKLPDDGKIFIEVEKDYGDKTRFSRATLDGFKLQGKVFTMACTVEV